MLNLKLSVKIKGFNLKHAKWGKLNEQSNSINWSLVLDSQEPDLT